MELCAARSCCPNTCESLEFPELGAEATGASAGFAGQTLIAPAAVMAAVNAGGKPIRPLYQFNGMTCRQGCWSFDESTAVVKMLTEIPPRLFPHRRIPAILDSFFQLFLDRHFLSSHSGRSYGFDYNLRCPRHS